MAASDDDSSNNLEDTPMKLPPFTEIKADGHFRYRLDLSRYDAAPLIAFTATKEIDYWTETDGRIPQRCGAYCTDQRADTHAGG